MKVTGLSWLGIGTADFPATVAFFTDVLGLEQVVVDQRGVALLKAAEGQIVELFGPGTRGQALTMPPVAAFEVEDIDAAAASLDAHGVERVGEIGRWNGFEWLYFKGPDGHLSAVKKTPPPGWEATAQ